MDDAHSDRRDVVRLVVIDSPRHQLLLIPSESDDEDGWTLPRVPIRPGETIRRAASRHLRRTVHLPRFVSRLSSVASPARTPRRAFSTSSWCAPSRKAGHAAVRFAIAPEACWWTTAELRSDRAQVEPAELLDFMDGYWGGWLPDGEISLE